KPEYVENFMRFIARDLREWMAKIGVRSINEMVGHVEKLVPKHLHHWKAKEIDLTGMLYQPKICSNDNERYFNVPQDHKLEKCLDVNALVRLCAPAINDGKKISASLAIGNTDRVCGAVLSSEITKIYGEKGLPDGLINLDFEGSAGQSFGAFQTHGVTMKLIGDANDYIGKGLSGGRIIAVPSKKAKFKADENIIIGNVAFYGAVSGEAYINGIAGERFCVRNSGITAVVEGVGRHGCEYMTGGRVAILGKVGKNFAAGMSGGVVYVYDKDKALDQKCNKQLVLLEQLADSEDIEELKTMIENHFKYTGSKTAKAILENWESELKNFVKVIPSAYKEMITEIKRCKANGLSDEDALMDAFIEVSGTTMLKKTTERSAVNG
ncbi:MAG: glutamate synthase subunit alpha, partial [Firmicutes bacterium]|nr:glutamate synthase subunit alpha [Bacillota bacterium]